MAARLRSPPHRSQELAVGELVPLVLPPAATSLARTHHPGLRRPSASGWVDRAVSSGGRPRSTPTVAAMELVLVRHGEPEWVRDGYSVDDPP